MSKEIIIWGVLVLGYTVQGLTGASEDSPLEYMSKEDRETLKEEARDMFYHAYNAYMDNAYPADELMPLSCKGRYRGSEADRGDIDSTLGNFSLTLVDTLDTLVVLGDLGEFENAVRLVVKDVTFDTDVIVSLFETNIRMLGGLLSGHILSEYLQSRADIMPWYRGELLTLAKDLGYRFLPAFNTTTGIPFGRINLRHGMKGVPAEMCRETCTACAGSMILEMAALSRLTGESIFEDKAQKAMDALWKMRHRGTDLMGSVLNVHSGDWVRRDSGVGAGIDSYYEYCLKAYILLGDEKYLGRFNKHYQAVMKYVSQGPMLLDVHMHRPNTNSKNFMDALLAFWPGLQVLKGDIKPAVETHEMLYQVMQRHNFIPEAFTTDFQVHWGHHPLRPEFLESTYFLYRATGDHYYLGVGRKVLKSLQTYARVPCGYAAVSDVRTNKHDDTMDSFVLSETFKYLYLLFAEPSDLILDLDEFIFTTEGHLLPLTLAAVQTNVTSDLDRDIVQVDELGRTCPNSLHLFPASVRQPLRNMVEDVCPRRSLKRRLNASQFQANNLEHLKILSNMGITVLTPTAGSVQVLHMFSNARTAQDAEEGLLFMQEMVELSKKQSQQSETRVQSVTYLKTDTNPPHKVTLLAGPAHFGPELKDGKKVTGTTEFAIPSSACSDLVEPDNLSGKIVLVSRGNCMFVEKARRIQSAGAIAVIVLDSVVGSSVTVSPMFAMSGDGKEPDDVTIPVVFLFHKEASNLVVARSASGGSLSITIGEHTPRDEVQLNAPGDLSVFERLKGSVKDFLIRQITPQNTGSTNGAVGTQAPTEMVNPVEGPPPIEYVLDNCPLEALLYEQMNIMKIVKKNSIPPPWRSSKSLSNFEKPWYTFMQEIVNDLYSSHKDSIIIPVAKIQFHYKWIQERRRQEMIPLSKLSEEGSMDRMIFWFLEEICNVAPYLPPHDEPTLSNVDDDKKSDEHRTSKHDHDKFSVKEDTSQDTLQVTNAITKNLKNQKKNDPGDPGDCTIPDTSEDSLDITEEFKQILVLQYGSEVIELIRSRLADAKKATKPNSSGNEHVDLKITLDNEKTKDAEYFNDMYYNIRHLKSYFSPETGILKIKIIETPNVRTSEFQMVEGFEHTWRELRRNILNAMYTDEELTVEILVKPHIESQYRTVQTLRRVLHEGDDPSLERMVVWFVRELSEIGSEVRPDVWALIRPHVDNEFMSQRKSNPEKYAKRIADLFEGQKPRPSRYGSTTSLNENSEDVENSLNEIGKALVESLEMIERAHSARNNKIVHESKNHSTKIDESSDTEEIEKPKDQIDSNDTEKSEAVSLEGETSNFLVQEEVVVDDPLEEFKKPIWAPEDGKDATKSFPRFEGKSDLSNIRYDSAREPSYDYQSEYTTKTKNDETDTRRSNKHIKDDL